MKLLIVDDDLNFGRILATVLEAEGHVVRHAEGPSGVGTLLVVFDPDVVLISVDATSPASMSFLEGFRGLPGGHRAAAVAIAASADDRIRQACAASNTDHLLVRPFSVLELAVLVRGLRPVVSGMSTEASGEELNLENTSKLMRLWARGANGVLNCQDESGDELVILANGGPVDHAVLPALRRMLHAGALDFQPCDVDGDGDPAAMAALLWAEACASAPPLKTRPSRSTVVVPSRLSEVAARLPLPSGLGLILSSLQGPTGLGRIADQYAVPAEALAEGMPGLAALGLLTLQNAPDMPVAVTRLQPAAPPPTFEVQRPRAAAAPVPVRPPHPGAGPRSVDRSAAERPWADRMSSVSPPSMPPRDLPPPGAARAPLPRPPLPALRPAGGPQALPPTDSAALIRRLRREVDMARTNDAWVVLGVPHDADQAMVDRAGERMVARYSDLVSKETGEAGDLAQAMLDAVRQAISSLRSDDDLQREDEPGEDAFRAGLRAMTGGDWALADRCFLAARDRNLDSVRNIAHAGWARVHNPTRPVKERTAEGLELLLLAEQLEPGFADGQYFLATVLHRSGDEDGALRRIRRALKADPSHVAASALNRKLRRPPV